MPQKAESWAIIFKIHFQPIIFLQQLRPISDMKVENNYNLYILGPFYLFGLINKKMTNYTDLKIKKIVLKINITY